jgi:hypothetical protein
VCVVLHAQVSLATKPAWRQGVEGAGRACAATPSPSTGGKGARWGCMVRPALPCMRGDRGVVGARRARGQSGVQARRTIPHPRSTSTCKDPERGGTPDGRLAGDGQGTCAWSCVRAPCMDLRIAGACARIRRGQRAKEGVCAQAAAHTTDTTDRPTETTAQGAAWAIKHASIQTNVYSSGFYIIYANIKQCQSRGSRNNKRLRTCWPHPPP